MTNSLANFNDINYQIVSKPIINISTIETLISKYNIKYILSEYTIIDYYIRNGFYLNKSHLNSNTKLNYSADLIITRNDTSTIDKNYKFQSLNLYTGDEIEKVKSYLNGKFHIEKMYIVKCRDISLLGDAYRLYVNDESDEISLKLQQ